MAEEVPTTRVPPPRRGHVVAAQTWRDVAFLHWEVDPARVAPLLPPRVSVDLFDGRTFVGLVPLRMCDVRIGGRPGVRVAPDFWETNVRLYSVDRAGRHGVVFRSLDASYLPFVLAARLGIRVPYVWSRMAGAARGAERVWTVQRRWPGAGPRSRVRLRVGAVVEPTPLEVFLTARWGLHSEWAGDALWTPVRHEPWTLHEAEPVVVRDELVRAGGADTAGPPTERVLFSPAVHATFGPPARA